MVGVGGSPAPSLFDRPLPKRSDVDQLVLFADKDLDIEIDADALYAESGYALKKVPEEAAGPLAEALYGDLEQDTFYSLAPDSSQPFSHRKRYPKGKEFGGRHLLSTDYLEMVVWVKNHG